MHLIALIFFVTSSTSTDILDSFSPNLSLFSNACDSAATSKIESCSKELKTMGVFSSESQPLSFQEMRKRSQSYFAQMCQAYRRYNECLGGTYIKHACYAMEPLKSRFAVVDAALEYVCGIGYVDMIEHWDCYLEVAKSEEITRCEGSFVQLATRQETMYNEYTLGAGACFALQTYIDCIRPGIENTCGINSFLNVVQAIEQPVHVYLPFCMLSSSSNAIYLPSTTFLIAILFTSYLH